VPVQTVRYETEDQVHQVPVTTVRMVYEEHVEQVPWDRSWGHGVAN